MLSCGTILPGWLWRFHANRRFLKPKGEVWAYLSTCFAHSQARLSFTTSSSTETPVLPQHENKASFSDWSQNGFISGLFRMRAAILRSNGSPALHELRYEHFRMAWQTSDGLVGCNLPELVTKLGHCSHQSQMVHFPGRRFPKEASTLPEPQHIS
jgi:hypothetical protein